MDLPFGGIQNAFQRFSYNIDLLEKRYANKRPSGLEMDCNTGKIIQVIDAKRPRLTVEEAKEKMKTSFLAPSSLLGNSSLSSPFVDDMIASKETKLRVLKHNKRFKNLVNKGTDFSTFLNDENCNDDDVVSGGDENREEEELFDLDGIIDDDDGDQEGAEDEDDAESEGDDDVSINDVAGSEYEEDTDSEDEFEVTEEEAAKEKGITYGNVKITRALIQHLTPKSSHGRNAAATSKKVPFSEETPKGRPRKSISSQMKERYQVADGTPKIMVVRTSASVLKGTPTSSKKILKAASEKIFLKKKMFDCTPIRRAQGKAKKKAVVKKDAPIKKKAKSASKKIGKYASKKAQKDSDMMAQNVPKFTRAGRQLAPKKVCDYDDY